MSQFPLALATSSSRVAIDEEAGELLQAPADPRLGGVDYCRNALVHGLGNQDVAGNEHVCLHLESSFDFSDVELYLRIRPVEHQLELAHRNVEETQSLKTELDVLDVRNVHSRDQEDVVALLEQGQHHVVEMGGGVDHHVGAERLEDLDDPHHVGAADLVGKGGFDGRREDVEAARLVLDQQVLEQLGVEALNGSHGVDDRVLGRELHHHGHVAELEVGIDQNDGPVGLAGEQDSEVGRHHRLTGAALGGEHADEPALGGTTVRAHGCGGHD